WYIGPKGSSSPNDRIAQFSLALAQGVNFGDPSASPTPAIPVAVGDYLELFGGGLPRRIVGVTPGALDSMGNIVQTPELTLDVNDPALDQTKPVSPTATNYRIIPQARDIPAEQPLKMPQDVGILANSIATAGGGASDGSLNIPPNFQILF